MAKRKVAVAAKKKSLPVRAKTIVQTPVAPRRTRNPPQWFMYVLKREYPEPSANGRPNLTVLEETLQRYGLRGDWVERVGSSKMSDDRDCFVAEPYDHGIERQQFESLCKALGLEFKFFEVGEHPGTIRLAALRP